MWRLAGGGIRRGVRGQRSGNAGLVVARTAPQLAGLTRSSARIDSLSVTGERHSGRHLSSPPYLSFFILPVKIKIPSTSPQSTVMGASRPRLATVMISMIAPISL